MLNDSACGEDGDGLARLRSSFERFCLTAGVAVLDQMLEEDAEQLAGPRHGRHPERAGRRWGATTGKIGFRGGKVGTGSANGR
jgi:putative transposase